MIDGVELLLILVVDSIHYVGHNRAVQILPLLVITGTEDITTGTAGLNNSLIMYQQFSSLFIHNLQMLAQIILTYQGQIDSLTGVALQN